MEELKKGLFKVPGAELNYKITGSGPILLMIHGGGGEAAIFSPVARYLANSFTVVTYDRRGHSWSPLEDPEENYEIRNHSEDAHRLLAHLTDQPAYIFGSSAGAVIGLDLIMNHPQQVKSFIPHEPPLIHLLPEAEYREAVAVMENLVCDYKQLGGFPALERFSARIGIDFSGRDEAEIQPSEEQMQRMYDNMTFFMKHEAPAITQYQVNVEALKKVTDNGEVKVIIGGGEDSKDYFPYQCGAILAERSSLELYGFPGNHVGYSMHPQKFGEALKKVLLK